jgi:hypothetical protein
MAVGTQKAEIREDVITSVAVDVVEFKGNRRAAPSSSAAATTPLGNHACGQQPLLEFE